MKIKNAYKTRRLSVLPKIFKFARRPYHEWQNFAPAGALMATLAVLVLSLGSRFLIKDRSPR